MVDLLIQLQAFATATATFTGTAQDLTVAGTPRRGLKARFIFRTAAWIGAAATATPQILAGTSTSSLALIAQGKPFGLGGTTGLSTETWVPFETDMEYIAAAVSMAGTVTSITVPYQVDIALGRNG